MPRPCHAKRPVQDPGPRINRSKDTRGARAVPTCELEARPVLGESSRTATNVSHLLSRDARRPLSDQTRHSLTYRSRATVLHGVLPISCKPHPYPPSVEPKEFVSRFSGESQMKALTTERT